MVKWLLDLFYYIFIWIIYVFFASVVLLVPIIVFSGNTELLTNFLEPKYFLIYQIPILTATILLGRVVTKNPPSSILSFQFTHIAYGFLAGIILIFIFVLIQVSLKTTVFSFNELHFNLAISFLSYAMIAVIEELLFRNYLYLHLTKKLSAEFAVIICGLLFGFAHIGNPNFNLVGFINISLFGLLMSIIYLKYKSLSIPIGIHFSWNFFQGPIFGYAVSGHVESSILNADITQSNPLLNGGYFGAEGSVFLILINLILMYFLIKTKRFTKLNFKILA